MTGALAAAWIAALFLLAALFRYGRRETRRGFLALRGLSIAALAALWSVGGGRPSARLAVVFDSSASMALPFPRQAETRWERALRGWTSKGRGAAMDVSYFRLDEGVSRVPSLAALRARAPEGARSDVSALAGLRTAAPGFDGLVFFSDGRAESPDAAIDAAKSLGVPLYAVGVDAADDAPDVSLDDVRAARLGYVGVGTTVTVRMSFHRVPPGRVAVALWDGNQKAAEAEAAVVPEGTTEIRLIYRPRGTGVRWLKAVAAPVVGETHVANNARFATVESQRRRLRVLYLAGRPGPHYAFLRSQLKTDPAVDLVSFVILRDPEDALGFPEWDLSLIPFPTASALVRQLPTFDVVLLENFSGRALGLGPAWDAAVAAYVRAGGGLLLAGEGDFWRVLAGAAGPLWRLLGAGAELRPGPEGRWPVGLTAAGAALLLDDAAPAVRPELETAPGAVWPRPADGDVLAEAPGGLPFLTIGSHARGRWAALSDLSHWRWALRGGPADYQRFWENLVRWLGASPDRKPLRIVFTDGAARPGEAWRVSVRTSGGDRPASLRLSWRERESGEAGETRLAHAGEGNYRGAIVFPRAGFYELRAASTVGSDRVVVECVGGWDETRDRRPDPVFLQRLAEATEGRYDPIDRFGRGRFSRWAESLRGFDERRQGPRATVFLLLMGAMCAEWFLRRRGGRP